jgi:oligoendopeptidase F
MLDAFLAAEQSEVIQEDGSRKKTPFHALGGLLLSQNKAVRDEANEAMLAAITKWEPIAEREMNAVLNWRKVNDDLRGYRRPDANRHLNDNIASEVVDALVLAVKDAYPISRRYMGLKATLMGYRPIGYHERSVPYGTLNASYSIEEAYGVVRRVLFKLDPQFNSHPSRTGSLRRGESTYIRKQVNSGEASVGNLLGICHSMSFSITPTGCVM